MNPLTYLLHLLRWFKQCRPAVAALAVCMFIEMAFNAWVPAEFSHLIDHAITPRNTAVLLHGVAALAGAIGLVTAASLVGDYLYARQSSRVLAAMRQRLFDHLQSLSPSFYQKHSAGEVSARYSTDLAAVEQTLGSWIAWGWKPGLDIIGYNFVLFYIDWQLALFAQLLWPLTLLGPRLFGPRAARAAEERKRLEAEVLAHVDEATAGRHVVRAYGLERKMSAHFSSRLTLLASVTLRGAFFSSALERTASVGIYTLQIAVIAIGAAMAFKGTITIGGLVAFYTVFVSLSWSLYWVTEFYSGLYNPAAGLTLIEEVLAERPAVADAPGARELPPIRRAITVRDCVYAPEPGRRILDHVSLTIPHGQSVAFVGPSGSGKSTMLNAIMRAFDPDEGEIEVDGFDLRTVSRASFIRQSAVVFQDSFLYNATVRENVRLGRLDATDADIEAACRAAEIHELVAAMPAGYDSPVGERGSLLSGGQRQRLAIARALVRNPRILILDEATSALDPGTEIAVNATVERISPGRTVLQVTHRLASVTRLDRIFVLDRGRLVEQGTHDELLGHDGLYAALWGKQEGIRTSGDGSHAEITVERLRRFRLLAPLDDAMLQRLADQEFVTETLPAGRDVVVEGDAGNKFYIIARGRVEVLKRDATGTDRRIRVLEDGDNFGELALLRDTPRSATIRTIVPSIFLTLRRKPFQGLLAHSPDVRAAILAQETERRQSTADTTTNPYGVVVPPASA